MHDEPISSFHNPTARNALERLRGYAERRILLHANHLRDLGEAVNQMEAERAKSAELFEKFKREP